MTTEFALDLRLARRKAGFTQGHIPHLLACHQSRISDLETGRRRPKLEEIIRLSQIYGRSFEAFFAEVLEEARKDMEARLETLPAARLFSGTRNRTYSLERLAGRLAADRAGHD